MHRLTRRVKDHVRGAPVAAGAFQPNFARAPELGIFGLVGIPLNWRREQRALDTGLGLAPSTLVVVTREEVCVFDAWLLAWGGVRMLLEHPRHDLVAEPASLAQPPPIGVLPAYARRAALRLTNRTGNVIAELEPQGWGDDVKAVFKELTGQEGWPPG